jgi:hypothetical protein
MLKEALSKTIKEEGSYSGTFSSNCLEASVLPVRKVTLAPSAVTVPQSTVAKQGPKYAASWDEQETPAT